MPRGVEHRPVAEEEVHVLLFEPAGTLNTGDVRERADGSRAPADLRSGMLIDLSHTVKGVRTFPMRALGIVEGG